MTLSRSLRLVVAGLSFLFSSQAQAAACFEELTDAAVCGTTVVEDATLCGVEQMTDAAECGTKKVTDAAKCGTETVADGAECGWETLTGLAKCGEKCVTSLGANCTCKVAKKCKVAKRCKVAKTCEKPKTCDKPKTCTRKLASCDPFPEAWKATVIAAVTAKHQDHLNKLKDTASKVPDQAALASQVGGKVKDLPDTLGPYSKLVAAKAKRLTEVLNDEKKRELVQRVVLKAANREIDAALKRDVKELAGCLHTAEDEVTDKKKIVIKAPFELPGTKGAVAEGVKAKSDDEEDEGRSVKRKAAPPPYPRVHAVTLNLGMGILANASVSIGVVFDDEGNVKGVFSGGYGFGIQGRVGVDITYTMISESTLAAADGVGIGVVGDAAYYGGVAVGVSWAVPASNAIPSWSVGPAVGVGAGIAYAYDTAYVF